MSCLDIVKDACKSLGIPSPSTATGSADIQILQVLALLNREGSRLSSEIAWQALTNEATFTTVATESQGSITTIIGAANNYRYILNDTIFNRSRREPIFGPKAPREWQAQKSLNVTGPFPQYRIRGGALLFDPVPTAGENCFFEYVTRNWVQSSDGITKHASFTQDEDLPLLDADLLLAGLEWRWLKSKGLDYAEEFRDYARLVADSKARDGTKRTLSLDGSADRVRAGIFVPIGSWNL